MSAAIIQAATAALADSLNALLIGVVVALGVMLPKGKYSKVVPLLIFGDWLGVFTLALLFMKVFSGLDELVTQLTQSSIFGIVLTLVGAAVGIATFFSKPGGENKLMQRILEPLREPGLTTVVTGFVLGVAQSITSAPFFAGLIMLASGGYGPWVNYGGMIIYASLALSLPTLSALLVGWVRTYPDSPAGRAFAKARAHPDEMSKASGYIVAVILIALGIVYL